jgi:hypothetical protein
MTYDRDEFRAKAEEKSVRRQVEFLPMAKIIASASPVMQGVTGDQNWDRYLSYLQGFIDRTRNQVSIAQTKMADPGVWEHKDLLKLKADILVGEAMVQALTLAITLPKAIMEGSEEAKKLIDDFEKRHEST